MTWLSVKKVSALCGIDESTVKKEKEKCEYRYIKGVGRGGRQLQIALETIPWKLKEEKYPVAEKAFLDFTGKQRENADFRALVVNQYQQSGLSPDEFVEDFNGSNPPEDWITKTKLYRWQGKYEKGGVTALIDQRGGHNRGKDTIPEEAWDFFYSEYMDQQKKSVKLCYDLTLQKFLGIPSVSAFERKVRTIDKYAVLYYREGEKAYRDQLPSMERSKRDMLSNDVWFSDHHLVDTFVKSADGKRITRPWLTVFYDARSNKVVSFLVRDADPNATAVKQCLRMGIERYGVSNKLYFDNGKDYRSKSFSKDFPSSLVNRLGISTIYATPYHGQAKTVERFFGTFTNRFSRRFPTYTGRNAKVRPECMQISNAEILKLAPTLEEYKEALSNYIAEYNATPSRGRDLDGKCPDQVYFENLKGKRRVPDLDALRLICGNSLERVVHKNGVSLMHNSYFSDLLLEHLGERVIVTYDPANIDKVGVFDMEDRAICTAEAKIQTLFQHTSEEDYIRAAKEKKAAQAIVKKYAPKRDMGIHQIIARNQLMEQQFEKSEETKVIEQITPQAARNAVILKETDTTATQRIRKEDSVTFTLLEAYRKQA